MLIEQRRKKDSNMKVIIKCHVSSKFGLKKTVELGEEDTVEDVIRNVCRVFEVKQDNLMYLKLEDQTEVRGYRLINDLDVFHNSELLLCTTRVSGFRWFCATFTLFIGLSLITVSSVLYTSEKDNPGTRSWSPTILGSILNESLKLSDDERMISQVVFGLMMGFGFMFSLLAVLAFVAFYRQQKRII